MRIAIEPIWRFTWEGDPEPNLSPTCLESPRQVVGFFWHTGGRVYERT